MDPGLRRGDATDAGTVEQPGLGEETTPSAVMAGLDPATQPASPPAARLAGSPGSSPGKTRGGAEFLPHRGVVPAKAGIQPEAVPQPLSAG
jgi:hypothetical protein